MSEVVSLRMADTAPVAGLLAERPGFRVFSASGHPNDAGEPREATGAAVAFLQKPSVPEPAAGPGGALLSPGRVGS